MADDDENYGEEIPEKLIETIDAVNKDDVEGIAHVFEEIYRRGWENHVVWSRGSANAQKELDLQREHAMHAEQAAILKKDSYMASPLHWTGFHGHRELVKMILRKAAEHDHVPAWVTVGENKVWDTEKKSFVEMEDFVVTEKKQQGDELVDVEIPYTWRGKFIGYFDKKGMKVHKGKIILMEDYAGLKPPNSLEGLPEKITEKKAKRHPRHPGSEFLI